MAVLVCFLGRAECRAARVPLEVTVRPNQILMGATYNGMRLSVSGKIPADTQAFIRLTGGRTNVRLKKKGRALGVLWMNLGTVSFHNVPKIFLIYPSGGMQKEDWEALALGFGSVKKQAKIIPASDDKDLLFREFVKLKQSLGLYGTVENAIRYGEENGGGMRTFTGDLSVPSDLPEGTYKIEVYAVGKGGIVGSGTHDIEAREVGMPAFISSLAYNHGTLYGILAVLIAIIAGLVTGIIFKGGGGGH